MGAGLGILGGLLIAAAACGCAIGLLVLWIGLRGRRVNDHPLCGKCRFDLVGASSAAQCPECGAPLTSERSVRRGESRKRPGLVVTACLLLSVGLVSGGTYTWVRFSSFNWNSVKPFVVLKQDARSASPKTMSGAAAELQFRVQNGDLHREQVDEVVRIGLELVADHEGPWVPEWGDVLEAAAIRGYLTREQHVDLLRRVISVRPMLRRKVLAGDVIPYGVRVSTPRAGSSQSQYLRISCAALEVDGQRIDVPPTGQMTTSVSRAGDSSLLMGLRREVAPGVHSFRIICTVEALGTSVTKDAPIAAWEVVLEDSLEVVASGTELFTWERDPSLAAKMKAAVRVKQLQLTGAGTDPRSLEFTIACDGHPAALACELFAVLGEREISLGTFTSPAGSGTSAGGGVELDSPLDAQRVDLVLRPSLRAMKASINLSRAWGEEIVIRDVPVTRGGQ